MRRRQIPQPLPIGIIVIALAPPTIIPRRRRAGTLPLRLLVLEEGAGADQQKGGEAAVARAADELLHEREAHGADGEGEVRDGDHGGLDGVVGPVGGVVVALEEEEADDDGGDVSVQ